MLIFKRLIHSASRGFPQWVELHYDDMDKLHPPWPLPPAVSGQRPVSRVPAAAAGVEWAEAHGGGPGETHGDIIIMCLQDCRYCFRVILLGDNRVKTIMTLPTIQLKLAIMIVFTTLTTSLRYRVG